MYRSTTIILQCDGAYTKSSPYLEVNEISVCECELKFLISVVVFDKNFINFSFITDRMIVKYADVCVALRDKSVYSFTETGVGSNEQSTVNFQVSFIDFIINEKNSMLE
jgi:hypothetical protein